MQSIALSPAQQDLITEAYRVRATRRLRYFCERMSPKLVLDKPYHALVFSEIEALERGELLNEDGEPYLGLILAMPVRHGKSEIVSKHLPAWLLGRNPDRQIILAMNAADSAEDNSSFARNLFADEDWPFPELSGDPPIRISRDSSAKSRWKIDGRDGILVAAGVGSTIVGKGADFLIVDDPFASYAEAMATGRRDTVWDWFLNDAFRRLQPNAKVLICACLTGDTAVTMADGTEKVIRNITPGDIIASYDGGRIVGSKVLNWKNQGPDHVYEIRMRSGITIRGNERHPFLVDRGDKLEWVRLRDLRSGDNILRAIGANGAGSSAPTKSAISLPSARDIACLTTARSGGQKDIELRQSITSISAVDISSIATASPPKSTKLCLSSRAVDALSADGRPLLPPTRKLQTEKTAGSPSIIATSPGRFAGYSATTVTSPLGTVTPRSFSSRPLNTFEITLDQIVEIVPSGYEDVFDIEVERTENFIANGLVSHNTRWHDDDLTGRILRSEFFKRRFKYLRLPALSEGEGDPLGRPAGAALDTQMWPASWLVPISEDPLQKQAWRAQYQQSPTLDTGEVFRKDWWQYYDPTDLERLGLRAKFIYVDPAFGGNAKNDETAATVWGTLGGKLYWMDTLHERVPYHQLKKKLGQFYAKWRVPLIVEDNGWSQILIKELRSPTPSGLDNEDDIAFPVIPYKLPGGSRSKTERAVAVKTATAESVTAMVEGGMVFLPSGASWLDYALDQLTAFPSGEHDDVVDSVVMALTHMGVEHNDAIDKYFFKSAPVSYR